MTPNVNDHGLHEAENCYRMLFNYSDITVAQIKTNVHLSEIPPINLSSHREEQFTILHLLVTSLCLNVISWDSYNVEIRFFFYHTHLGIFFHLTVHQRNSTILTLLIQMHSWGLLFPKWITPMMNIAGPIASNAQINVDEIMVSQSYNTQSSGR